MKKTIAIAFGLLLLSSLLFSTTVSPIESEASLPVKEGNISYIDNADAYISATPHTLTADGYVYLNVTSKRYGGEVDFCFGFDSKLGYPRSLELYDPRTETTQHELDLNPYWGNPDYNVDFNFTSKKGETLYDGCILVYQNISITNERNQTVGWECTKILDQVYNIADLDTKMVYWNTTHTSDWTNIRDNMNFDKKSYSFQRMDTWYLGNATIEQNKEYYLRMWLTIVPTLEDVTHEYFVAFKPHDETMEQAVLNNHFHYLDPWYNVHWQYRKSHVINSTTGAGTNYQVRITVHYDDDDDLGEHVYLNGKCQSDFDDIRFTDNDEETLLDYWREDKDAGNYAIFWVEVTANLSVSPTTIYIYYGNDYAPRTDDPLDLDIFQLREYDQWGTYGWDPNIQFAKNTSTIVLVDSYTSGTSPMGRGYVFIQARKDDLDGKRIQLHWRCYFTYSGTRKLGSVYVVDNPHLRTRTTDEFADGDGTEHPVSDYTNIDTLSLYNSGSGWSSWTNSTSDVLDLSSFSSEYVTILIGGMDAWIQQKTMLDIDYMKVLDANNITLKTFDFDESVVMEQTGTLRDYGLYRKYVAGYNPHGTWGAEETTGDWSDLAVILWGIETHIEQNESNRVENVLYSIETNFNNHGYENVSNFFGAETQRDPFYNSVDYCESNYDFTTVFYKGDAYYMNLTHPHNHTLLYDDDGPIGNFTDWIFDYDIYDKLSSCTHDFVFLWACGTANWIGGFTEDYSWGMAASWFNTTDLSEDGYDDPDPGFNVFIGFENFSKPFLEPTNYSSFDYGNFASYFYYYALVYNQTAGGRNSINDALNFAALDTMGKSFSQTILYGGYTYTHTDNSTWQSRMRIFGNGNITIPW